MDRGSPEPAGRGPRPRDQSGPRLEARRSVRAASSARGPARTGSWRLPVPSARRPTCLPTALERVYTLLECAAEFLGDLFFRPALPTGPERLPDRDYRDAAEGFTGRRELAPGLLGGGHADEEVAHRGSRDASRTLLAIPELRHSARRRPAPCPSTKPRSRNGLRVIAELNDQARSVATGLLRQGGQPRRVARRRRASRTSSST